MKKTKEGSDSITKITICIPSVKGVLEALSKVFHHHRVAMAMKPLLTLKKMLVHSKDKRTSQENAVMVFQVPCKDCLVCILVRLRGGME